jgi:hypothetical protein
MLLKRQGLEIELCALCILASRVNKELQAQSPLFSDKTPPCNCLIGGQCKWLGGDKNPVMAAMTVTTSSRELGPPHDATLAQPVKKFRGLSPCPQERTTGSYPKPDASSSQINLLLHGLSPRANYTDRATAACRRSDCQLLRIEGATWSA